MSLAIILTITVSAALGLSFWILNRLGQLNERHVESAPMQEIENEMTVSEFNALIEERESAARAPLESRIADLESRLNEESQDVRHPQQSRERTP
ncbi:MAG: hypothetical protein ACI9W4_001787 [Rhodothermales bacterium]|jgi:hypothetical protein